MSHSTEWIDYVDKHDQVVGSIIRENEDQIKNRYYVRAANGFIRNSKGQLWIPRRVASKKLSPLGLDISISGYVQKGEDYEQAFARELEEEVNLRISEVDAKEIGYFGPQDTLYAFTKVYEIHLETTPNYNTVDFCDSYWLYPEELYNLIQKGEKAKSDLPKLLKLCYLQ